MNEDPRTGTSAEAEEDPDRRERTNGIGVFSEIGYLRQVLICKPGDELNLVTPGNMRSMLVDDPLDVQFARHEHKVFTDTLLSQGVTLVDEDELLLDVLADHVLAEELIDEAFRHSLSASDVFALVRENSPQELLSYLVTGNPPKGSKALRNFSPIVNKFFTRDIGAVIGQTIIPGIAYKNNRKREMRMMEVVFRRHSLFTSANVIQTRNGKIASIEGGDIQMLGDGIVGIGWSERSRFETIHHVADQILECPGVRVVIIVKLVAKRSCMHLDTIFTRIDQGTCLVHEPMVLKPSGEHFCSLSVREKGKVHTTLNCSLLEALAEYGLSLQPIICGGSSRVMQEREQFTDGANALAIRPGHILQYSRNRETLRMLQEFGYIVVKARDLTEPLPADRKFAIVLDEGELSRGRGGPHCMSFPLFRDQ